MTEKKEEIDRAIKEKLAPKQFVKTPIHGTKFTILVSSAKGGVGKSTIAINLAFALQNLGLKIGKDIDLVAKDAVDFLKLFRNEIIVIREDMDIAGEKLALAAIHAAQNPDSEPLQYIDQPKSY